MRFKRFLFFIFAVVFFTACDDEYKTVYHYRIEQCNSYVNLREQPSVKAGIVTTVGLNEDITILECKNLSVKTDWSKIRTKGGQVGYVQNKFIGSWTSKEKVKRPTVTERLQQANQPVTWAIFSTIEKLNRFEFNPLLWLSLTIVLAIIMILCMFIITQEIHWWHYLLLILFCVAEFVALVAAFNCEGKGLSFGYVIPDLLLAIGVLALPFMQGFSYYALLLYILDEDTLLDDGTVTMVELITTLVLSLGWAVCIVFFPTVADISLYIFLGIKLLMWLVFIFTHIKDAGRIILFCVVALVAEIPLMLLMIGLAIIVLYFIWGLVILFALVALLAAFASSHR